jgi:hypothetical protein
VASTTFTLLFVFWPGIRPDPPPAKVAARISNITVAPGISLRSYYVDVGHPERAKPAADRVVHTLGLPSGSRRALVDATLNVKGLVVYAEVTAQGFKDRPASIAASVYDAGARTRVQVERNPSIFGVVEIQGGDDARARALVRRIVIAFGKNLSSTFIPEAGSDQVTARLWIPAPARPGRTIFVRLGLFDRDANLITYADSQPFRLPAP